MSTLRRLPKQGAYGPQKNKQAHVVHRAARSNRYWPEFPISTLPLRKTLCLPHSGVKPGAHHGCGWGKCARCHSSWWNNRAATDGRNREPVTRRSCSRLRHTTCRTPLVPLDHDLIGVVAGNLLRRWARGNPQGRLISLSSNAGRLREGNGTRVTMYSEVIHSAANSHPGNRPTIPVDYALTTDFSGSIRKVQISAPLSKMPVVTRKGAIQKPL
jgi:hypothetical protein